MRWIESSLETYSFSNSQSSPILHSKANFPSIPARYGNNKRNFALCILNHFSSLLLFLLDRLLFITFSSLFSQSFPFSILSLERLPVHLQTEVHSLHHNPSQRSRECFQPSHPGRSYPELRPRKTFVSTMNPIEKTNNHRFFLNVSSVAARSRSNAMHSLFSLLLQFLQLLFLLFIDYTSLERHQQKLSSCVFCRSEAFPFAAFAISAVSRS